MAIIINKTPHPIHIINSDTKIVRTFPLCPGNDLIRLSQATVSDEKLDGVPTSRTIFGEAVGLPEYKKGVYYIVSQLVKSAKSKRKDLLVPTEVVRNESGQIIGCRSLGR